MTSVLEARGVTKAYGDAAVLRGADLAVDEHRAVALIRELKAEGMTTVIATHGMGFAREVADKVCFLHAGAILERGAPTAVLDAPREPETQRFLRRLQPT
jgi:ABC-type polar amino acid transport system ATPase subunit